MSAATRLAGRARLLAWFTVVWNVIEAAVGITAGVAAASIALVGFGVDAVVETFSAGVVLWRLRDGSEDRERRALMLIGGSFFLLAGYVTFESVTDLVRGAAPEASTVGIVLTALSLVVMPLLAVAKRRVGHALESRVVLADAAETLLCAALSAVVLGGLALNGAFGWWWADPVAALGVAVLAVREGREAWEEAREGSGTSVADDVTA